jgi:hypothetical protein
VAEEFCWAITGGDEVMMRPIRFQGIGVYISTELSSTYIHSQQYEHAVQTHDGSSGKY